MNPTPSLNFGTWLKSARTARDWSQDTLAVQANCGVQSIRRFERNEGKPSKRSADLLATAFRIPADEREDFIRWARQVRGAGPPSSALAPMSSPVTTPPRAPLPIPPTPLIGRETAVAQIMILLANRDVRLVTLIGPGGVGKTRLALAIAHEVAVTCPASVAFVPLATIRDPALVLSTVTAAVDKLQAPDPLPAARPRLVVIDNFEHLMPAAAALGQLLEQTAHLQFLVTSRETLHLYGEHEYPILPLDLPAFWRLPALDEFAQIPAVRLFVGRAQAVQPNFVVTEENAPQIAEICYQMDGLPLALELAAARIKTFTPATLLEHMADRFKLLTGGPRNGPERQRTLCNAIAWSYQLLEPEEQLLFARLAVFIGGFTVEAAEAVCSDGILAPESLLDRLVALVDKSLLRYEKGAQGSLRFGMLETIREYAELRLQESGEAEAQRARHAEYYVAVLQALCAQKADYEAQLLQLRALDLERANLRALIAWAIERGREDLTGPVGDAFWELGLATFLEGPTASGWELA